MGTCPECHKNLDQLSCVVNERNQYGYCDGDVDWSNAGEHFEHEIEYFSCPHCYKKLTEDREEADKLLEEGGNIESSEEIQRPG